MPATVLPRANRTSLTFQISADAAIRQRSVTVTAEAGAATVQETIQVTAASGLTLVVPDVQTVKPGGPIRFTVATVGAADLPVQLAASSLPTGARFDTETGDFEWIPGPSQTGRHHVQFTANNTIGQSASAQLAIEVVSGKPILEALEPACSPGAVAAVKGRWLAESAISDPSGNSTELGGTRVMANGQYVPVLSASTGRVQFLCPALDPGAQLDVTVETTSEISLPLHTVMQDASPWIFSLGTVPDQGLVSFAGTNELAMVRNARAPAHPAQPGDQVLIWGTGFGSPDELSPAAVSVKLGGWNAEVQAIRQVTGFAGVFTIQVQVHGSVTPGDAVPVQVEVISPSGKQMISNTVTMAIE